MASHAVLFQLCKKIGKPSIYSTNYIIVTGLSSEFLHILHLLGQTVHGVSGPDVGGAVGGGGRCDALLTPPAQAWQLQRLLDLLQLHNPEIRVVYYRVIFDNLHQELTFYRLVLGLLRFFKALM